MMRMLVILLSLVVIVLGFVLNQPWLYAVAALLVLGVLISLYSFLKYRFERRQRTKEAEARRTRSPEDDLKSLGIMEIRPKVRTAPPRQTAPADEEKRAPSTEQKEQPQEPPAPEHQRPETTEPPRASRQPPAREAPAPRNQVPPEPSQAKRSPSDRSPSERPPAERAQPPRQPSEQAPSLGPVPPAEATHPSAEQPSTAKKTPAPNAEREPKLRPTPSAASEKRVQNVLQPYLQALRAAIDADVVCFLKQEDLALQYKVEAFAGPAEEVTVQRGESFSTRTPLLTASMSQRQVTVQRVGDQALPPESLGYRRQQAAVRQVMLAPVSYSYDPSTYFLLADTAREGSFNSQRPRTVITQFAELLAILLERSEAEEERRRRTSDARPRREIIEEEMERARVEGHPLALALVYLNRAEALAEEGEQAVLSAERVLKARLEEATPHGRVERFGELTFGVFYEGDGAAVEEWAMHLQQELAQDQGRLAGGISIGIALLSDRHDDPEALRAEATEALREAYETGTCTILE